MTALAPTRTELTASQRPELTGIERYTILVALLGVVALWFKTAQFAAVTIFDALAVGYGLIWAAIGAEIVIAGIAVVVYLITKGAKTGHMYRAALGALGTSLLASGLAWVIMAWALR